MNMSGIAKHWKQPKTFRLFLVSLVWLVSSNSLVFWFTVFGCFRKFLAVFGDFRLFSVVLLRPPNFHRHHGGWLPPNQHRHHGVLQYSRRSFWALFPHFRWAAIVIWMPRHLIAWTHGESVQSATPPTLLRVTTSPLANDRTAGTV